LALGTDRTRHNAASVKIDQSYTNLKLSKILLYFRSIILNLKTQSS